MSGEKVPPKKKSYVLYCIKTEATMPD